MAKSTTTESKTMGCDVWTCVQLTGQPHSCLGKLMGNQRTLEHTYPVDWTIIQGM